MIVLAVRALEVATPLASVTAVLTLNAPLAPLAGVVKVTEIPETPIPLAFLRTTANGAVNAVFTLVLWLLPELIVIEVGGAAAAITKETVAEAESVFASLTVSTTEDVPLATGVPEITPVF